MKRSFRASDSWEVKREKNVMKLQKSIIGTEANTSGADGHQCCITFPVLLKIVGCGCYLEYLLGKD